jgi:hypothetical protein
VRAILAALAFAVFARVSVAEAPIRVEIGMDGDPGHLIEALRAAGYEAELGSEASDQDIEDAQGVWIGRNVPVENVKQIVLLALGKYPHLRYYKFFGSEQRPAEWDRAVYVGGHQSAARGNTKPLEEERARAIFNKLQSFEQLRQLIESLRISSETPSNVLQPTRADGRG